MSRLLRRRVRAGGVTPSLVPTVTGFSPTLGPVGTVVGISGANYLPGTSVTFGGVSASTVVVAATNYLTAVVPAGASTGAIAVTTSNGTGTSASPFTVGALNTSRYLSRFNPVANVTQQIEYPRGHTSTYDVQIDEAAGTLTANSILWNWPAERVGAARHTAIPGGQRLTVTTTGTQGWTDFQAAVTTAIAGSGDWEIIVPNGTIQMDGQFDFAFPVGRRLYVTCATLQPADVMPSLAGAFCTFVGPAFSRSWLWAANLPGNHITFTGIRLRANSTIGYGIFVAAPDTQTSVASLPSQMVFDRCVLDGNDRNDIRRGMVGHIDRLAVLETQILDISQNSETAGFGCWSGTRYVYMRNVNLEASGIAFMPGGAPPFLPNTGLLDPHDFLLVQVAATKRDKWMPGLNFDGRTRTIKNGFETKNVRRLTLFKCATVRHRDDLGQTFAAILKNADADDANLTQNATQDIVILLHDFVDCSNGFSVLGRGSLEVSPLTRVAAVDVRFRDLGRNASGTNTTVWGLYGEVDDLIIDRWTVLLNKPVDYGYPSYQSGGASSRLWLGNTVMPSGLSMLVGAGDSATASGTQGLRTVWAEGANSYVGNNVFYGPSPLSLSVYPNTTEYSSATAAGINATTGALSGDILTRGIGGSVPGARVAILDTMASSMAWAYNR